VGDETGAVADPSPLSKYQSMRDFGETPEPAGDLGPEPPPSAVARFVIQEHHATALHWDLRLEHDGVLASWALPKGVPPDPRVNHLAVHTEDHPMQYLTFHGDIPTGNYGAGTMTVWDSGTYETVKWGDREVIVVLHGKRAEGRHVLFQTRGKQWMIHRMDPPADPGRELWPGWDGFAPMEAVLAAVMPPDLEERAVEFAWGGQRVLLYVSGGRVQVRGAGLGDEELIGRFRELRLLGEALGVTEVVLDGEVIVPGADGRPSASLLADRLGARSDSTSRRLAERHPAVLMIADLVWLDGHSMTVLEYAERRDRLSSLSLGGPAWQAPASYPGTDGPALLMAARQQGLAGVVAKRLASTYQGGAASEDWVFVAAADGSSTR
jgi:bifunctional non-homologous end joining protein LigD